MNHVSQTSTNNLPDKIPETVEKDVRKWVESICEFKANLEMEKCGFPNKKSVKKTKKLKVKKEIGLQSVRADESKKETKCEQKIAKPKLAHKKDIKKEKQIKEKKRDHINNASHSVTVYDNLKDQYKNVKLPPNWVSGQSRGRLVFCRVKVISRGSQYEMVSDIGIAITNDCMVHVFINGPEIILNNWKMQKVETVEDIRKTIKAVDGFKICSGVPPNGSKSPSCSVFLNGESKTCQACNSDAMQLKLSGLKMKTNPKLGQKTTSFQK